MEKTNTEKVIESLLSATECLLMGKYEDAKIEVDSEGLISNLAQKIKEAI